MESVCPELVKTGAILRQRTSKVSIMMKRAEQTSIRDKDNAGRLARMSFGKAPTITFLILLCGAVVQSALGQSEFRPVRGASQARPPVKKVTLDRSQRQFQVVETGPNHERLERAEVVVDERGEAREEIKTFVRLATGLNYWDESASEWVESKELIEAVRGGAIARQGAQQVKFANRLNVRGAVEVRNPDGHHFRSSIVGLAYRNARTGAQQAVAQVKATRGKIIPPNQVLYSDAFDGVRADVLYIYRRHGFSQNVVLREKVPGPEEFGMDPSETVELVVVTEFFDLSVAPTVEEVPSRRGNRALRGREERLAWDQEIAIGEMQFGIGEAFTVDSGSERLPGHAGVGKHWLTEDGRHFLFETVDLAEAEPALSVLPQAQAGRGGPPARGGREAVANLGDSLLPDTPESARMTVGSESDLPTGGYLIDYQTISANIGNYVFKSGVTTGVENVVSFQGHTRFEGGTVIKLKAASIVGVVGSATFETTPFSPVIITSYQDDSAGERYLGVDNPTPTGYLEGSHGLYLSNTSNIEVANVHVRYCKYGISMVGGGGHTLRNIQISTAYYGIFLDGESFDNSIRNALIDDSHYGFVTDQLDGSHISGENLTVHDCAILCQTFGVDLKNSLIVDVATIPNYGHRSDGNNFEEPSASGIFRSVGGGHFYLANDDFRDEGTDQIHPALKYDLERMTTHPPVIEEDKSITTDTTWTPHVQRDNNGTFDVGYHYPAVDYLVDDITVDGQAVLTVEAGTVLGEYGDKCIRIGDDAKVHLLGTVTEPVTISWYGDLQDAPDESRIIFTGSHTFFEPRDDVGGSNQNELKLSFVNIYRGSYKAGGYYAIRVNAGTHGCHELSVSNCQILGKTFELNDALGRQYSFRNNLFTFGQFKLEGDQSVEMYNNLFLKSTVYLTQGAGADHWAIRDNVFYETNAGSSSSFTNATYTHNAFVNTSLRLGGALQSGDQTPSSLAFVTGPFGDYYMDSDVSGNQLLNTGSRSAPDAGLFHYTTGWPNDLKEGTSSVDIGLHYPSTTPGYGATGN